MKGLDFPNSIKGGELPTKDDLLWVCYVCGYCEWNNNAAWGRVVYHRCVGNSPFLRRMYEATDKEYAAGRAVIKEIVK